MRVNKYFPFVFFYFFLNSVGLPHGLTYTTILAPLLYIWILAVRKKEILLPYLVFFLPYAIIHYFIVGIESRPYIVSFLNLTLTYIVCQAAYTLLKQPVDFESMFRRVLVVNFILCLVAIPFYFTGYSSIFWIEQDLTAGVANFKRLKLFTYEASYYATLLVPLLFYFSLQYFLRMNTTKGWLLLPMLALPFMLSFSVGVTGAVLASAFFTYLFYFKSFTSRKRVLHFIMFSGFGVFVISAFLFIFYPDNTLFIRLENIFSGTDTSGQGRTADAFLLAERMIHEKSPFWGIGLGQIKILGENIIRDFYMYPMDFIIRIPNAMAETLAMFGWVGFAIRISIELFLFFYTKVWSNYFRLLLFFFAFIYQFTGSYLTNIAEYVVWILAFTNVFPQFDARIYSKRKEIC